MTRERGEKRLDDLVRGKRLLIAGVFPAMGALFLVASAESLLPGPLNFNPYLILFGTLVMRLPLVAGVAPLTDRRALLAMLALTVYSYGIEYIGTTTGWPYGDFAYGIDLGPMLFGEIPLGLPVFFFPLVLNSYLLCLLLLGDRAKQWFVRLPVVVAAVIAVDLVLDPGAVSLGFWTYDAGGAYYQVPWSNYLGWVLSATVAVVLFDVAFDRTALIARVQRCEFMLDDLVSFVILWGAINAYFANVIPVTIAGLFFLGLVQIERFDFAVVRTVPLIGEKF